jgi:hypothetical protein
MYPTPLIGLLVPDQSRGVRAFLHLLVSDEEFVPISFASNGLGFRVRINPSETYRMGDDILSKVRSPTFADLDWSAEK